MRMWRWTSAMVGRVAFSLGVAISTTDSGASVNWPAGLTGQVRLERNEAHRPAQRSFESSGIFRRPLPTLGRGHSLADLFQTSSTADLGCAGDGSVNPDTAHYPWFAFTVPEGEALLGSLRMNSNLTLPTLAGTPGSPLLFVTLAADFTGTVPCPTDGETYEEYFASGWNLPHLETTARAQTGRQQNTIRASLLSSSLTGHLETDIPRPSSLPAMTLS